MKKSTLFSAVALLSLGVTLSASVANAAVTSTDSQVNAKFTTNNGPVVPPGPGPGPGPINPPLANELGFYRGLNDFDFEAQIDASHDRNGLKVKATPKTGALAEADRYLIVYDGRLSATGENWKVSAQATQLSGNTTATPSTTKSYVGAQLNLPAATIALDDTAPNAKVTDKNQTIKMDGVAADLIGVEAGNVAKLFSTYQIKEADVELEVPAQSFEEGTYSSTITFTLSPSVLP
ncbi:WxL domain surface cell wall-binding [Pilibacter termitis]|uniref:WxL domain surface cell wall-binding n=1 Tax=Pilibacter termitis TaxID=263852 RepID=A0A1T4M4G8_9ENTE|nr:WxL domain-containing protein [Pilibacter termitis]SJZ61853.1 WxL domain surface cell wall-binding [Pilibacter termitis]